VQRVMHLENMRPVFHLATALCSTALFPTSTPPSPSPSSRIHHLWSVALAPWLPHLPPATASSTLLSPNHKLAHRQRRPCPHPRLRPKLPPPTAGGSQRLTKTPATCRCPLTPPSTNHRAPVISTATPPPPILPNRRLQLPPPWPAAPPPPHPIVISAAATTVSWLPSHKTFFHSRRR
jgi:hypothetical protein